MCPLHILNARYSWTRVCRQLTPRIVRKEVEERLGFKAGTLDQTEYKVQVRNTIDVTVVRTACITSIPVMLIKGAKPDFRLCICASRRRLANLTPYRLHRAELE